MIQYPSLLYTKTVPSATLSPQLPEDLKLTLLLPEAVLPNLLKPCGKEDILARQSVVASILSSPALRARMQKLLEDMDTVGAFHESFQAARSDNERFLTYLGLLNATLRFYRGASDIQNTTDTPALISRFADFFGQFIKASEFSAIENEIQKLYPIIDSVRKNRIRIRERSLSVIGGSAETFEERLARCSAALGFQEFSPRRDITFTLSTQIIDAIARLYPAAFSSLESFYTKYRDFFNPSILQYESDLRFYLEIASLCERIQEAGIPLCYPDIAEEKVMSVTECYDITLLAKGERNIIPNDIRFDRDYPFFYLTGANGGGKTTYLRTVGIAALLFLNGCPVPCRSASIFPLSGVFTHFPRDERFDGDGRFADEKRRVADILSVCGDDSLVLLNETFATTSEEIAVDQTRALADTLYHSGCLGLYITHQHSLGEQTIPFLNVVVDTNEQNRRTYKIARRRGVSGSFAQDILKKYHLTREALEERFPETGGNA